eukprot:9057082-Heterocapsa_arctica.AAC.1
MVQAWELLSINSLGKGQKKSRQKSMLTREENIVRHIRRRMSSNCPKSISATRMRSRMNRLIIASSMARRSEGKPC